MLCHYCYCRTGVYRVVERNGGGPVSRIICKACHQEQEKDLRLSDLPQMLSRLIHGVWVQKVRSETRQDDHSACPGCGFVWRSFKAAGQLGCDRCYETFRDRIMPLVHDGTDSGDRPGGAAATDLVDFKQRLQRSLDRAVAEEAYEMAALFRDKIERLVQMVGE
jgi:protein arginine kinase activator